MLFGGLYPPYILFVLPQGLSSLLGGKAWPESRMDIASQETTREGKMVTPTPTASACGQKNPRKMAIFTQRRRPLMTIDNSPA
jgi:hypothetical protein